MLWSTILCSILIFVALIPTIYAFAEASTGSPMWYSMLSVIVVLAVAYLYAVAAQIMGLHVTENAVIIKKMAGRIVIPRNDIVSVCRKHHMMADIRLWGISGLFGHIGLFSNYASGKYHAYAKDGNNLIAIETTKRRYVVSCDNADEVVRILQ